MKLKTLVAIAASSLFAASFTYAAPTSGSTDDGSAMPAQPTISDNIGSMQGANSPMSSPADSSGVPGPASSNSPDGQMPMDTNTGTNDEMSADTATGDDDY